MQLFKLGQFSNIFRYKGNFVSIKKEIFEVLVFGTENFEKTTKISSFCIKTLKACQHLDGREVERILHDSKRRRMVAEIQFRNTPLLVKFHAVGVVMHAQIF